MEPFLFGANHAQQVEADNTDPLIEEAAIRLSEILVKQIEEQSKNSN